MNKRTFIISDTHFQHANMLNFAGADGTPFRKFANQEECDELMIENWNKTVRPEDTVWHLGDVWMGDPNRYMEKIHPRLMGKKRALLGNHDDARHMCMKNPYTGDWLFQKVELWRFFKEHDFIATHVPMQMEGTWEGKRKARFNVHGHIHANPSPTLRHWNACVEMTNYTPVDIEEIAADLKKRVKMLPELEGVPAEIKWDKH